MDLYEEVWEAICDETEKSEVQVSTVRALWQLRDRPNRLHSSVDVFLQRKNEIGYMRTHMNTKHKVITKATDAERKQTQKYSCANNCGKTFGRKYTLQRHEEKCKSCEHCGDHVTNLTGSVLSLMSHCDEKWNQLHEDPHEYQTQGSCKDDW